MEDVDEHTRNLLHGPSKSCYLGADRPLPLYSIQEVAHTWSRLWWDFDADDDDQVDECDKDQIVPTIDLSASQASRHASKRWTTQSNDVLATGNTPPSGIQYDDCQEVEVVVTPATVDCGVSIETDITVQATDA
jgi:hypothetical protein